MVVVVVEVVLVELVVVLVGSGGDVVVTVTSFALGEAVSSVAHDTTTEEAARSRRTVRGDRKTFMSEATLRRDPQRFDVIAFDADDTLWHSEDGFHAAENTFCELLSPFVADGVQIHSVGDEG